MTELTLQPIPVATTSADEDGRLVLADGRLVAVLVRLADAVHEEAQGRWHLEAGFGQCMAAPPMPFADLPEALAWVAARLGLTGLGSNATRAPTPAPGDEVGRTNGVGQQA